MLKLWGQSRHRKRAVSKLSQDKPSGKNLLSMLPPDLDKFFDVDFDIDIDHAETIKNSCFVPVFWVRII